MTQDFAGFHSFLFRFPSLGLAHELGREIRDNMREQPLISLPARSWYRGVEEKDQRGTPGFEDFLPPDPHSVAVPEQRFNHQGERVFYLAESARGAALECSEEGKTVWTQRIRIAGADRILDLTGDPDLVSEAATYSGELERLCRPPHLKPEYRVPRFVAECARYAGVNGLLVPSTKEGTNLVLFTWRDEDVSPQGEPQRITV